jgi:hypothetical protein
VSAVSTCLGFEVEVEVGEVKVAGGAGPLRELPRFVNLAIDLEGLVKKAMTSPPAVNLFALAIAFVALAVQASAGAARRLGRHCLASCAIVASRFCPSPPRRQR